MHIGYARVSTAEQSLDLQLDALHQAGCEQIYSDCASGSKPNRPGLTAALSHPRPDDVLIIWKLDRLGRTVKSLVDFVGDLADRRIHFRSLADGIDTSTPTGRFFLSHHGVLGPNGARVDRRAHPSGLGRRAPAGAPRRAKAAHDAQQGAIGPTTAPERCASPRSRPEPGGVDSDAVPLDTRFKPLMIKK